jgi:hypothetical protein
MTTVKDLMERASTIIAEDPGRAGEFGGVYKFVWAGDEGRRFIVNVTDQPRVIDGDGAAQRAFRMAASDFIDLFEGRAHRRVRSFTGKLSVEGDWAIAMKIKSFDEMMGDRK